MLLLWSSLQVIRFIIGIREIPFLKENVSLFVLSRVMHRQFLGLEEPNALHLILANHFQNDKINQSSKWDQPANWLNDRQARRPVA